MSEDNGMINNHVPVVLEDSIKIRCPICDQQHGVVNLGIKFSDIVFQYKCPRNPNKDNMTTTFIHLGDTAKNRQSIQDWGDLK